MEAKRVRGWVVGSFRAVLALAAMISATAGAQRTERVSVNSSEAQGNRLCGSASISNDGRYVAFQSYASNLVSGDSNASGDIFVRDRLRGTTECVSVASSGAQGNGDCFLPSISADGRYVAFESAADNLVSGDSNLNADIFVRDRLNGTTERVSVDSAGAEGNSMSASPSISADGRYVAFWSYASNLVSGDTNGTYDVFVRDRQIGTTERVSVDSSGAEGNSESYEPSISADGRYVAFWGWSNNLVSGDTNVSSDVFVRDLQNGTTERVSVDALAAEANNNSYSPSISADGRTVAFYSNAGNLVLGDSNGVSDVFVRDRLNGTTERVSLDSLGGQGNSGSRYPSISADGRTVAFDSYATNLVSGDTNARPDIYLHDRQSGATVRVSVDSGGAQGNNDSVSFTSLSADGGCVAFGSAATNLVGGDTNGSWDIFVRDRFCPAGSATFSGDGINADFVTAVNAILGSSWSAPLTLGHAHGTGGPLLLRIGSTALNGPNFASPVGGRSIEILVGGALLTTIGGVHDGVTGDIATLPIPSNTSLVGQAWAAQYIVVGGGFIDLSQAVFGVVGCQ